ncbi:MAG: adenine/guanine/hypoxanthine permease [Thermoanaerobacteraceae bacterium]|nr:adenine/guanine/hypoxanthine permease [Thermoanaerobacteraceae bacterium]
MKKFNRADLKNMKGVCLMINLERKVPDSFLERYFHLSERKTDVRTEFVAGFTTFLTMAYIIAVNPIILSSTGMPKEALFTSTILAAGFTTLLMGFYANLPFALASGMGLNAFFAAVCNAGLLKGVPNGWQIALCAVLFDGIIFIILSLSRIRSMIVYAIPVNLKRAVSVGIGLFITTIGLELSGLIVIKDNRMSLGSLSNPAAVLAIIGLIITAILMHKKVKGSLLWGILITSVISWIYAGIIGAGNAANFGIFMPAWNRLISLPPSIAPIAFKFNFNGIFNLGMMAVVFGFLFVDMFDTIGTFIGCAQKAQLVDEKGNMTEKDTARGLLVDAIGTTLGACLGVSTVTTYIESAAGIAEGGRTGLSSVITGLFFMVALFFSTIFTSIPGAATAPALIIVGLLMFSVVKDIDISEDWTEAIPAFLTIIVMPLAYSISDGIVFGIVSYTILKLLAGKTRDISPTMYVLSIIFIAYLLYR